MRALGLLGLLAMGAVAPSDAPVIVSVRDLVEAPSLSGLRVSPDGRMVAFRTAAASIAANAYDLRWWVMPVDAHAPARMIASGGDALFTSPGTVEEQIPIWSPQSDAIYVRALIDGAVQIWRLPIDGSGAQAVTREEGNVTTLSLSADHSQIHYRVGPARAAIRAAERQDGDEGTLVDQHVDLSQPLGHAGWIDGRLAVQRRAGPWFTRGGILWQQAARQGSIPIGRAPTTAAPAPTGPKVDLVGAIGKPPQLHYTDAGGQSLAFAPPGSAGATIVSAVPYGSDQVLVSALDAHSRQTLSVWTPATGAIHLLRQDRGLLSGSDEARAPCATGAQAIVCVAQAADQPPELVRIDAADGNRTRLFDPNAELRNRTPITVRPLNWDGAPGQRMAGELMLPPSPRPATGYPLVISYYLCRGFLRGGVGDELPMQPLARAGIAVLCVNHALGPTPERIPTQYALAITGLRRILARLTRDGLVDPHRVGMGGLSFGSEVTMRLVTDTHLLAAAAIASVQQGPGYYWTHAMPGSDFQPTLQRAWQLGSPDRDAKGWKRLSPALQVAHIHTPLLMQMPESEARDSVDLYARLAATRTPVEFRAFAHEAHIFEEPRHKAAAYDRTLDWFRFWLQGAIDPDPAKADQYARWRRMASVWRGQD